MNMHTRVMTWAAGLVLVALAGTPAAETSLAPGPEATNPLGPGAMAPDFTVYRVDGSPYPFDADALERPT